VIDSSGSNQDTDPQTLRIAAGRALNDGLTSAAEAGQNGTPDRVTLIDFDGSARDVCEPGPDGGRRTRRCP
jgi:hypothetical protein